MHKNRRYPILKHLFVLNGLISIFGVTVTLSGTAIAQTSSTCPAPALSRFLRYTPVRGETLDSIAQQYNLTPETIVRMNPRLQNRPVTVGSEILIPPFNGTIVEVASGQTLRDVAKRYKIRPDVLYEINGCQKNPRLVFVPAKNDSSRPSNSNTTKVESVANPSPNSTTTKFTGYPLAQAITVALPYGWQTNPKTGEVFFHSGMDLLAAVGTPVQAIGDGIVAFASEQGTYGKLVVINHSGGLQSRYAHLEAIKVTPGQQVKVGDVLGTVGTTGQPTTVRSHLHFEVRVSSDLGWVAKDPQNYFK
jgi:murein DD-endopeptidase MepM/ murein hydrolase activator NlpD